MGYDTLTNVRKTNPSKTSQKPPDDTVSNKPGDTARKQPGDTARKQPGDTARKTTWRRSQKINLATQPEKPPVLDLAGWQHTMGWRPLSPGIGDRMAHLHKLASLRTRS